MLSRQDRVRKEEDGLEACSRKLCIVSFKWQKGHVATLLAPRYFHEQFMRRGFVISSFSRDNDKSIDNFWILFKVMHIVRMYH